MRVLGEEKASSKTSRLVKSTDDVGTTKNDEMAARIDEQDRSYGSVLLRQFEVREGVKAGTRGRFTTSLEGVRFTYNLDSITSLDPPKRSPNLT